MTSRIHHIPGYRSTPRTISQAQRRAEADSRIEAVKRAKAPALGAQALEPVKANRRVSLWAIAAFIVIVGLFTFFTTCMNPIAALAATAFCVVIVGMCAVALAVKRMELVEDWEGVYPDAERPHIPGEMQ